MSVTSASILHLGLDVHKDSVVSAVQGDDAPQARQVDTLPYDLGRLKERVHGGQFRIPSVRGGRVIGSQRPQATGQRPTARNATCHPEKL